MCYVLCKSLVSTIATTRVLKFTSSPVHLPIVEQYTTLHWQVQWSYSGSKCNALTVHTPRHYCQYIDVFGTIHKWTWLDSDNQIWFGHQNWFGNTNLPPYSHLNSDSTFCHCSGLSILSRFIYILSKLDRTWQTTLSNSERSSPIYLTYLNRFKTYYREVTHVGHR
jgi:hypothetical protein